MARPIKVRGVRGVLARLVALGLVAVVTAGCSVGGRVVAPTAEPPRLLDPTRPAQGEDEPEAPTLPMPVATSGVVTERTVQIVGTVESVDGAIWVVDGLPVRVEPTVVLVPSLGPGSLVRVAALVRDDDDDETLVAVSVDAVSEVTIVGQVTVFEPTSITVDGRVIVIPSAVTLPGGLAPGAIVRVVVDDDDGRFILRAITILPEAQILGGTVEVIDGDIVVIGGQRLRLAADVVLWRVRLVVGEPVRIIVIPVDGVLTIITITIVTIIVPPPVVVVPVPTAVVVPLPIVEPAPRPAPRPEPPPSNRGGDDDDDDDDD